mgnify:CR=1 FL=1
MKQQESYGVALNEKTLKFLVRCIDIAQKTESISPDKEEMDLIRRIGKKADELLDDQYGIGRPSLNQNAISSNFLAAPQASLMMSLTENDRLLITTVVKDVVPSPSDSTYLHMINDLSDTLFTARLSSDLISTNEIDVVEFGLPKKVVLDCNNFTGKIEFQLIKIQ